jgi:hypothetical protein
MYKSINELIHEATDFLKKHYEYLLPFSFLYLILQLPSSFITSSWVLIVSILFIPLSFSIPYFVHQIVQGKPKTFGLFFEVYKDGLKYFGITAVKYLIILVLFLPVLFSLIEALGSVDYDVEKLLNDISNQEYQLTKNQGYSLLGSLIALLISLPFLVFTEFFGILEGLSILDAFKASYHLGARHYLKVYAILGIAFIATFLGVITCFFGLLVALPFIYCLLYFAYLDLSKNY